MWLEPTKNEVSKFIDLWRASAKHRLLVGMIRLGTVVRGFLVHELTTIVEELLKWN